VYTAHSIPVSMAAASPYVGQLEEACALVSERVGQRGVLVFQSRSGPPGQPWLGPDIGDYIRTQRGEVFDLVIAPIGFLCDHMEVVFDLDTEMAALCAELGIRYFRAGTAGTHPAFVTMVREMISERVDGTVPSSDACAADCCPPPVRQPRPGSIATSARAPILPEPR
jgi:ferrochelatase